MEIVLVSVILGFLWAMVFFWPTSMTVVLTVAALWLGLALVLGAFIVVLGAVFMLQIATKRVLDTVSGGVITEQVSDQAAWYFAISLIMAVNVYLVVLTWF